MPFEVLEVTAVVLVVLALAPPLAHALEIPGKRRLDEETFRRVQAIWVKGEKLGRLGSGFFGVGAAGEERHWTALRDRWDRSHLARALLAFASLLALVNAVA